MMKVVAIPSFAAVVVVGVLCLALANSGQGTAILSGLPSALSSAAGSPNNFLTVLGAKVSYEFQDELLTLTVLNGTSKIGTVALGIDTLCRVPGYKTLVTCYLCNNDCIYVHNTYGGTCAESPAAPGNYTCLCADTEENARARKISQDSKSTCQAELYESNLSKYLIDPVFAVAVRARMDALLCLKVGDVSVAPGYNNSGCAVDCDTNHGYPSGVCNTATPKYASPVYLNQEQPHFCTCTPPPPLD